MATWFCGLSSTLGSCLGQMSHSVMSFTRHISRCTKDVWMMEYKTEESNELRRKEVETTKESIRTEVERVMTFYSDVDLENKQETAAYNDLLIKEDLDTKFFIGKDILEKQELQNLQEDTQSVNAAAGFVPATSSTLLGENIHPKGSEYKHELEQKTFEMTFLRERHEAMKRKFLKLQKATESINVTTSLVPAAPASISLGDNIDHNASEYEHQLEQQNLEMKILKGRNVAMRCKLLKLQKATECLNAAAGPLPATSSTSLGKNIDLSASEYEHAFEQKTLEMTFLRERHEAMKRKFLKLQKATESINVTTSLVPAAPASISLGDNIDHNASEYEHQLEQQNLEMKILKGRNVAMRRKLLKLQKATECLNAAAGPLPATSSRSLGENIDPVASEYEHELERRNRELKIQRGRNVAMKHKLLKLQKATQCLNVAAGPVPATPGSASLAENIDHKASEYKSQLEQQNLEMKILRGRNVAMKHKLLKLQKAAQRLNEAAGLVPATSSASLGENTDASASECKHDLEQKNLEVTILRERHGTMNCTLLKLENATKSINMAAGPVSATSTLSSRGDNIDHNASEYEHQLVQQNLKMKFRRGRNVAMKRKLLKLQKVTECLNAAAGLLPSMSSAALGGNIDPSASEYKRELERRNLKMKILRGRNVAMKHTLLNLQKITQCLNAEAGLVPTIPVSTSPGDTIDHNASEYKNQLKQENLKMKFLRGRKVAMKQKLLNLQKATQCLNVAAGLLPGTSSASRGGNFDPSASEYQHELERKTLEMKIRRERQRTMKRKLLKLQKATECINAEAGLLPATSSTSLGKNIDPSASEYEHALEQKTLEMTFLRERHEAMKRKFLKLQKATESINVTTSLVPAAPASISLGDNIDHNASEYEHQLEQQNLEMKILKGRNVAMRRKLLKLQKATECLNAAAGPLPATSSRSLGENIDPVASEYEHELERRNLELKIQRGRNVAMKHKLLKLQKATQCLNVAAGPVPATPGSASLAENIDHKASEYKSQLEQQNLEMKILRGRNVAMKHKLLKLQKATQRLNVAAGLVPATSSASLGENTDASASECKHDLEQKNLEVTILRERHGTMNCTLLKLENATKSINMAAGPVSATSTLSSRGDNIDHNASEYEHQLVQQNLKMKFRRGRNVAMKRKLLKLQKVTECLNAAAGLLPSMSSAALDGNIDPSASEYKRELERRNLKMKILRGRNVAMKHTLLNLQKITQCLNAEAGLVPTIPVSTSPGDTIDHNASEYKNQLKQENLKMKFLRGRKVAMKQKLLNLQKATQCLNVAAGLLPGTSSASRGGNFDPSASEYQHELERKTLEMKIRRERQRTMKRKLLKLQKATECINAEAGLLPATSSTSLGKNIDPSASEYEHALEQKTLEMTFLRERHEAMKRKFLKLQKATESINVTTSLVPAAPASISLGDNIDHNASEYEHQLEQQNLEMKILKGRNVAMRRKLLKLQKATECLNAAAGPLPATSSRSLGENIDPVASEYEHELERRNRELKIQRGRNVAMKHKLLKLQKATQCLNVAAGPIPATPDSSSLAENIDHKASEYKSQLEQQNLEMKILRGRNVAMKHKLLKLQKAAQRLNEAAGLVPATSSASLGENTDASASECKHDLEQKNLEVTILRERHGTMNCTLLKLENATKSINMAAGPVSATSTLSSRGDNIDHNASEYEHQLVQQNLKMKFRRGRNVAMKRKLLKLQKVTECLNAAAGLLPSMSSAALDGNIDPSASEYKRELERRNLKMKILRGRNVAMKHTLLNLQKITQCLNAEAGLVPTIPVSTSPGDTIDHNASEYKNQLKQENLKMKFLRGRKVAMKQKLLNLQKATQCLNVAAGLLPGTSSASRGGNFDPSASEYQHELERKTLEMKIRRERQRTMKRKLLKLQKATECINAEAGLLPATSSTSLGKNIDPSASEYEHALEQKTLEMTFLRERHEAMKRKFLKLQKATESINVTTSLVPAAPASISLGDNIDHNASEYEHQLEQQNLEMKILKGRNVAMRRKLLKLQKATECLNAAAGPLPATSSRSLGENIDPVASEYEHELERRNRELKIQRGRNVAMKHKLLKLQKATQCLNVAAGPIPATPDSSSLAENIDHKASEYKSQLEQQNLEMKILRGRNVAMKHKLLKLQKAAQRLNEAAGLVPATSSASLGENTDASASECKHDLEQKNLEVTILRERHGTMNCTLLKLENATKSINMAAGPVSATSTLSSRGDNIDHNASEYEHQLVQQNLKMKFRRGRNVAMKRKLLKLQKVTECLNAAAGLLPSMSSAALGGNIDPSASEYKRELERRNLKMKILRGRNVAMKHTLLNLQKITQCLNAEAGLVPTIPVSTSPGDTIDHNASEYKNQLKQENLKMKFLRGRKVAMKQKLLNLQKATQCLNVAAGLLPGTSSASRGGNFDPSASEYQHELERKTLEMKIRRERQRTMKRKLLKLQKATECINAEAGLLPATSSTSLGKNIDPSASEYEHALEQKTLEMTFLRERHEAMKRKFLKLQKATESINVTTSLVPAAPASISLGDNIDHNASEYEHQLEQQNLEMKILKGRNVAMRRKLLKLQKATECLNAAAGPLPATSSRSLGENIDPVASEYEHELERRNRELKIQRGRNVAMKHKLLKLQKATQCLNVAAGPIPATPDSSSLAENIDHKASEYKSQLEQQNLEMKILRGRNVAMKHKLLKLQKAAQRLNEAAGLVPATSSASLGENTDASASECKHDLEQKNLEVTILRERHGTMNCTLLKLENATKSINMAAGPVSATSTLSSRGDNIDHNASEYEHQLVQQNLKMKFRRGRNVAMKRKLLKLQKVTECLNAAAGLLPSMSSAALGGNIDPSASEYKRELERRNLKMKILRGRNVAMKHTLLNLQKITQCLNAEAGLVPTIPVSTSPGDTIDHNASEYKNQLKQENLKMKFLRGRKVAMKQKLLNLQKATQCLNVAAGLLPGTSSASRGGNFDPSASEYQHELERKTLEMKIRRERQRTMKRKLLKLQKATECINAEAGLLPATSSTSLGKNIDPSASEYEHALEQKTLEMTFLRERHEAMKRKFLKLQKATESINVTTSLVPAAPASISLGDNIDHNASEYEHQLEQQNLEMKILKGRNVAMRRKLLKLQKATECLNAAAGPLPATSSRSLGENIDPVASEYEHELERRNRELKIQRGRNVAMKHKLLKLQKATQCLNVAAGPIPATPDSSSLAENIDHKASEYKSQLEQQNLEMKILRGRNVAMKHKLLKLQKAAQRLNEAAGLVPATSSASLGENTDASASECKHDLEQKNLEVTILRERHGTMNCTLLKLENATKSINMAAGPVSATSTLSSRGDNIDHNASEYEHQLVQQNLKMKFRRGRNVAMKRKLLKLQKVTECLNAAAGLLPSMSSAALGGNIDPSASEYKRELERRNLKMKILRGRNVAMKHTLLNLQKITQCLNAEAGLVPTIPVSTSPGDTIDHNASEYKNQLKQENLKMKFLRGRKVAMKQKLLNLQKATQCLNVAAGLLPGTSSASRGGNFDPSASEYQHELERKTLEMKIRRERQRTMKRKLLKLQKATECINAEAGLLPATSSTSLGKNIDPSASEYEHALEQKTLEMTFLRERHEAMKRKFLKLQKATESINVTTSLVPAAPASISLGDNIDHNASEYEHQLVQQNLKMKFRRGRNVAMKRKLLKLQKVTECLNAAAGLLPSMSSAALGGNIDPSASEYKRELERRNLKMKILRGRNVAMKHTLLNLQKITQCLNAEAGLVPTIPVSTSPGDTIDHNASEYKNQLKQENLKMKFLRGRKVAMKQKLLNLQKATQCLNVAAGLLPGTSSASRGGNFDPSASEYQHELERKTLEMKIRRERQRTMKRKLLKLQKATECINAEAGLLPATSSTSLGKNIDPSASEYEHALEQKTLEMTFLRERHEAMKRKFLKLQKATESINVTTSLVPAAPASISLGDNIDHNASEYEHQLVQQNLKMKFRRGRNVAMKRKLLKLQKVTECLNAAAGLLPSMSSAALGENIDPVASEYEHELERRNRELKIQRGRNVAMKHKLLKLQKATQCLNVAAGPIPATPDSSSLAENIDHKASEYKSQLEQQNLEMKILRGRNVAMKHKLLKLQKAAQRLNEAAGLVPATSSASLGENTDASASECKHDLEQKNLEVTILRERHGTMNCTLLKLENATKSINMAAGPVSATSTLSSRGDNIDHNASEYEHQLVQQNLKMKFRRGRNVAMKRKLLKLQKVTECLNAAAGLLPSMSSAALGGNIDPSASEYKRELERRNLKMKILRGRNVAMKHTLLNLQKITQCLNAEAGLVPTIPVSTSPGDTIDHNASEYKNQLKQENLKMKFLRGRKVAMKQKLLNLQKATQCLNVAAGLLPGTSSASRGGNFDPSASEYQHELEQRNRELKIQRGRNVAVKHKLLKLQKATQCLNVAAGPVTATPGSISLAENIDHKASEYKRQVEEENLEMKIQRGRNVAMKHKLLKVLKTTQCLNEAAGLVPATSSASVVENIDSNPSEYKHELMEKNQKMKVLRDRHEALKHKLLKLHKATQSVNAAPGLIPAMPDSTSLGDNADPNDFDHDQLELKNINHHTSSICQHLPEQNDLVDLF